jgi:hypothetical protein
LTLKLAVRGSHKKRDKEFTVEAGEPQIDVGWQNRDK